MGWKQERHRYEGGTHWRTLRLMIDLRLLGFRQRDRDRREGVEIRSGCYRVGHE